MPIFSDSKILHFSIFEESAAVFFL